MTPLDAPPAREVVRRSKNAERLGVLFVHSVGQSEHSATLVDFGTAFAGGWRVGSGPTHTNRHMARSS